MFNNSKKILAIALPAMVENLLQTLMGVIDGYLIAQLGLVAVSGVSVATNILAIYQAIFIALGTATSSIIARNKHNRENIRSCQVQVINLTMLVSLTLGLLAICGGQFLFSLLGIKGEVQMSAVKYFAIVGGGIVGLGLFTSFSAMIRAQGRPQLPMYVSIVINIINAIFSALSVFVWNFGIIGVALATVLSRLIGVAILLTSFPNRWRLESWTWQIDRDLLFLSLPAAGERLMMRAGDVVILSIIIQLGTTAVAGNAIGETLTQFNYLPGVSIATAVVILMGQLPKPEQRKLIKTGYALSLLLMLAISGLVLLLGPNLIALFTENSRAAHVSWIVLLASFLGTFVTSGTLLYTAVWQGLGDAKRPFYATTIGMWLVRIGIGYLVTIPLGMGYPGVWLATILDNFFRWTFLSYTYHKK